MKRTTLYLLLAVAGSGMTISCGHRASAAASDWRRIVAGPNAALVVRTEGSAGISTSESSNVAKEGETIHRVLRGEDGKALFAYDVAMTATADQREYLVQLSPARFDVPTFESRREVMARTDEDLVRVELLEQPETHEKIVDVYRVMAHQEVPSWSLMEMHNRLFRWVHSL